MADNSSIPLITSTAPEFRLTGAALVDYLNSCNIRVPPAARRRWRRRARLRELEEEELASTSILSEQQPVSSSGAATRTQFAESDDSIDTPPTPSRRVLAAMERVWDLERTTGHSLNCNIDDWDIANPNPSKLGRAAEHASLVLDVFCRVKPVDDNQLTQVQKGLI